MSKKDEAIGRFLQLVLITGGVLSLAIMIAGVGFIIGLIFVP